MKWTKAFRKSHGKEMTVDKTFDFERRRHVPVKYDRELMGSTIKAMKRVAEIKAAREQRFFNERHKGKKAREKRQALAELKKSIDLIEAPTVRRKRQENEAEAVKTKTEEGGAEDADASMEGAANSKKSTDKTPAKEQTVAGADMSDDE